MNQAKFEKEESRKPQPVHFPFSQKEITPRKYDTDPGDEEDDLLIKLSDPKEKFNLPKQEKIFFQILKRDHKGDIEVVNTAEERIGQNLEK